MVLFVYNLCHSYSINKLHKYLQFLALITVDASIRKKKVTDLASNSRPHHVLGVHMVILGHIPTFFQKLCWLLERSALHLKVKHIAKMIDI